MAEHPFGHEFSGVDTRSVLRVGGILLLFLVVTLPVLYFVAWKGLMPHHVEVVARPGLVPPKPHLQPHPERDLARLRADKQAALSGYAWIGTTHQFARIPIQRAMALYVHLHAADEMHAAPASSAAEPHP